MGGNSKNEQLQKSKQRQEELHTSRRESVQPQYQPMEPINQQMRQSAIQQLGNGEGMGEDMDLSEVSVLSSKSKLVILEPGLSQKGNILADDVIENGSLPAQEQMKIVQHEEELHKEAREEEEEISRQEDLLLHEEEEQQEEGPQSLALLKQLQQQLAGDKDSASESFANVQQAAQELVRKLEDQNSNDGERGEALQQLHQMATKYYNSHRGYRWSGKGKRRKALIVRLIQQAHETMVDDNVEQNLRDVAMEGLMNDNSADGWKSRHSREFFREQARTQAVEYSEGKHDADDFKLVTENSYRAVFFTRLAARKTMAMEKHNKMLSRNEKGGQADTRMFSASEHLYYVDKNGQPLTQKDREKKEILERQINQLNSPDFEERRKFIDEWVQMYLNWEFKPEMLTSEWIIDNYQELLKWVPLNNHFGDTVDHSSAHPENKAYYRSLPKNVIEKVEHKRKLMDAVMLCKNLVEVAELNLNKQGGYNPDIEREIDEADQEELENHREDEKRAQQLYDQYWAGERVDYKEVQRLRKELEFCRDQKNGYQKMGVLLGELEGGLSSIRAQQRNSRPVSGHEELYRVQGQNYRDLTRAKYGDLPDLPDEAYRNASHLDEMNALVKKSSEDDFVKDEEWDKLFDEYVALVKKHTVMSVKTDAMFHEALYGKYSHNENGEMREDKLEKNDAKALQKQAVKRRTDERPILDRIHELYNQLAEKAGLETKEKLESEKLWDDQQVLDVVDYSGYALNKIKGCGGNVHNHSFRPEFIERLNAFYDRYEKAANGLVNGEQRKVNNLQRTFIGFFLTENPQAGISEEEIERRREYNEDIMRRLEATLVMKDGKECIDAQKMAELYEMQIERVLQIEPEDFEYSPERALARGVKEKDDSILLMMFALTETERWGVATDEVRALISKDKRDLMDLYAVTQGASSGILHDFICGYTGKGAGLMEKPNFDTPETFKASAMPQDRNFFQVMKGQLGEAIGDLKKARDEYLEKQRKQANGQA